MLLFPARLDYMVTKLQSCLHFSIDSKLQLQENEPLLASFLHTSILAHPSLGKALSHLLASKMQSRTLLGTQLMRLIYDAYQDDPVCTLKVLA